MKKLTLICLFFIFMFGFFACSDQLSEKEMLRQAKTRETERESLIKDTGSDDWFFDGEYDIIELVSERESISYPSMDSSESIEKTYITPKGERSDEIFIRVVQLSFDSKWEESFHRAEDKILKDGVLVDKKNLNKRRIK